jgi:hypothetical protein
MFYSTSNRVKKPGAASSASTNAKILPSPMVFYGRGVGGEGLRRSITNTPST